MYAKRWRAGTGLQLWTCGVRRWRFGSIFEDLLRSIIEAGTLCEPSRQHQASRGDHLVLSKLVSETEGTKITVIISTQAEVDL